MKSHVKAAIKGAGLRMSDVIVDQTTHYRITLPNGRRVSMACSPKNSDHTILNAIREIRKALR